MISKNQIKDGGDLLQELLQSKGEMMIKVFEKKYIPLEMLRELRQQLKNKLCTPSNHKKLKGGELICNSCEVIETVLCVEGE